MTLECIRRHYVGEPSPLDETLAAYADFFALFDNFAGYVDFWLLGGLVQDGQVRFWTSLDDFASLAVPQTVETYSSTCTDARTSSPHETRALTPSPGG